MLAFGFPDHTRKALERETSVTAFVCLVIDKADPAVDDPQCLRIAGALEAAVKEAKAHRHLVSLRCTSMVEICCTPNSKCSSSCGGEVDSRELAATLSVTDLADEFLSPLFSRLAFFFLTAPAVDFLTPTLDFLALEDLHPEGGIERGRYA
ncbi:hypothetical protein Rctr197k_234 [Virus Rctr197k]|nr:hypothetical protein Rctr197k_234 [Virus Rctr197k]